MMGRIATTAAATAAAALLLAGCGGGGDDGKASDEIKGTDKSPSPSKSASAEAGAPKFDLPSDVKVEVSDDVTGDKTKDAILRDHGFALMAMQESLAKAEATENFKQYWSSQANAKLNQSFKEYKKAGDTITGVDRFYARKVTSVKGNRAAVAYCEDQSKAFDKHVSTGKVYRNAPSLKGFIEVLTTMEKAGGQWKVVEYVGREGSKECQQLA
ncbi:hypothetical protein [Streptomyces boninensis]|uniref:hypothetical protein n=1 Tax=Streptomyces boninensis TaxID=2039455 RepID=UPI003B20C7CA